MTDISKSNISSSSKRRISEIDDTIEYITQEINQLKDFGYKTELECSLLTLKLKREKVKALSAVARSQVLLADMDVLIAETDLFTDIERLKNFKRIKLDREDDEGLTVKSQKDISTETSAVPTNTATVQTTKSMFEKKTKRKHGSLRKSPVNISTEETVLIPTIYESISSLVETSQAFQTSFSPGSVNKPLKNKSDSELSLSSSIRAEFGEPYTKTQAEETGKIAPKTKQKSDKHIDSKSKSKHAFKPKKPTQSAKIATKTVADLRSCVNAALRNSNIGSLAVSTTNNSRSDISDRTVASTSTYVPVRHNMPAVVTQPRMSTSSSTCYVNADPRNSIQYYSQRVGNSAGFDFYGSKQ